MVLIIMNTSPQNLHHATPSEIEWQARTNDWSYGDSQRGKEKRYHQRQFIAKTKEEKLGSAQIKTIRTSDYKTNPTLRSAS